MDKFDITRIPQKQVDAIRAFIMQHNKDIGSVMRQKTLQDDVFSLLKRVDPNCIILYYPNKDPQNNGFHAQYPAKQFVYINTAQHYEKQIFTAAHELGHIWELDKWMRKNVSCYPNDSKWDEKIMNRFAAELLMPDDMFAYSAIKLIEEATSQGNRAFTLSMIIRVVTALMDEFFTPYKAVVRRLFEQNLITDKMGKVLWGEDPRFPREIIETYSQQIAMEHDYKKLYKTDNKRWVDGLDGLFRLVKSKQTLPVAWMDSFCENFDFDPNGLALDEVFSDVDE